MRMLRALIAWLLLALPAAAAGEFELRIQSPFGEPIPAAYGTTVMAEVSNHSGQQSRVRVEMVLNSAEDELVLAWSEITLPARSTRQVELRFQSPHYPSYIGATELTARLIVEGQTVMRRRIQQAYAGSGMAVVLSPRPGLAFSLPAFLRSNYGGFVVREGRPGHLPTSWIGYSACSMVIMHDRPALNMTRAEMEALADWVRLGGYLILISNQDPREHAGTPLGELLPLEPRTARPVQGVSYLVGDLKPGSTVLASTDGVPLMIGASRGHGKVMQIAPEMIRPEMLGTKRTEAIWYKVEQFADRPEWPRVASQWEELPPGTLRYATICGFLVVYFVAAGPLNFWFLRKRERRIWALVTLPLLAVGFSAVILGMQWATRGLDARVNQGGVVAVDSGHRSAGYFGQVSLFSVWEGRYSLQASPIVFLTPDEFVTGLSDVGLGWTDEGSQSEVRNVEVNAWSGRSFQPRAPIHLPAPIALEVRLENGRFRGRVSNGSGWVLEDCRLITRDRISAPFRLTLGEKALDLPVGERPRWGEDARHRERIFESIDRPDPDKIWLTGWLHSSPEPVRLVQPSLRTDTTLVVVVGEL